MTSEPPSSASHSLAFSRSTFGATPKKGKVAEPGFSGVMGRGVIRNPPVSVCHQVSIIGLFSLPTFLWYHIHASGLMGSPTEPRILKLERSRVVVHFSPSFIKARIAVGAV